MVHKNSINPALEKNIVQLFRRIEKAFSGGLGGMWDGSKVAADPTWEVASSRGRNGSHGSRGCAGARLSTRPPAPGGS